MRLGTDITYNILLTRNNFKFKILPCKSNFDGFDSIASISNIGILILKLMNHDITDLVFKYYCSTI